MFIGEFVYSVDNKGRIVLPPAFRSLLRGRIYVMKGFEHSLAVYDEREWEKLQKKYAELSEFEVSHRNLKRKIFSGTTDVVLDKQGRIKVPQVQLAHAEIDKEVVIVGVYTHIEIWAKERWDAFSNSDENEIDILAAKVNEDIKRIRRD